ncbi:hypothetical protein CJJ18_03745 [Candidatus Williamhamiltonella defendens]|uniref:Transposase Synechocystis PCC 6803 domain-containing protein n=1 Tax=Candidatus Williamhamiltonella defendens TaxID=138072 RepID=A0AAC9VLJ2_9ENTR|nr:hypothetical protein CJJ18_03745 [Candidatus Hamiltonella defensa]
MSIRETAKRFHKEVSYGYRYPDSLVKTNRAKTLCPRRRKIDKDERQYPDAYQRERAARFGLRQKSICQALKRWRLTYKKMRGHPKADEKTRHLFQDKIARYQKQVKPLVYSMKETLPTTCQPLRIFSTRSALFWVPRLAG